MEEKKKFRLQRVVIVLKDGSKVYGYRPVLNNLEESMSFTKWAIKNKIKLNFFIGGLHEIDKPNTVGQ